LTTYTSWSLAMSTFTEILNTNTYEMAQTSKLNQVEFPPDSTAATFDVDKYEIAVEDEPLPEPARYVDICSFIPSSLPKMMRPTLLLRSVVMKTTTGAHYQCRPRKSISKEQRRSRTLAPPLRWRGESPHYEESEGKVSTHCRSCIRLLSPNQRPQGYRISFDTALHYIGSGAIKKGHFCRGQ